MGAYAGSVVSFRGDLIRSVVSTNVAVTVMTGKASEEDQHEIQSLGAAFQSYPIYRNAISPIHDMFTLVSLRRFFRASQPDLVLAYTIKPIIFGGLALFGFRGIDFFALVTGLGYAFQGGGAKRRLLVWIVVALYRLSLSRAKAVIFQNSDDRDEFVSRKIVQKDKCHVVNGSGVNLTRFPQRSIPTGPLRFLLIARLLGEKGIREYVAAARKVKAKHPEVEFHLVGPYDSSPDGIRKAEVSEWLAENAIIYHGATSDVTPFLVSCHVYCLPSYHEGMPRTVLEAMAVGRPILTTEVRGCKETVVEGLNGWLVPARDVDSLANKMQWFVSNPSRLEDMGKASRRIAVDRFDVDLVNKRMLGILGLRVRSTS